MDRLEGAIALVFWPGRWCGQSVLVLHESRVDADLGTLWRCRSLSEEIDLPGLALLVLSLDGACDPDARELLHDDEKVAWDNFHRPPNVEL